MKTLIPKTSLTYQKRLVRLLNSQIDGFYTPLEGSAFNVRCNRARIKNGVFQVKHLIHGWGKPDKMLFFDAYSREIVASTT